MTTSNRYLIFSDESGWDNDNQFGSLALVSGTYQNTKDLNFELKSVLEANNKKEIRFKNLKNNHAVKIAEEFLNISFKYLLSSKIKIYVLVWDKKDSRHNVPGRCDIQNLKRMYYKIMIVIKRHWMVNAKWEFYPDEFSGIDWDNDIIHYLKNTTMQKKNPHPKLSEAFEEVNFPDYTNVKELESNKYAIIQLADLYAGLIRTSRSDSKKFMPWYQYKTITEHPTLFDIGEAPLISNSQLPKFELMYRFKKKTESLKMGVSLNENKYFSKRDKKFNLFIWHYEPQGTYDKAPTKNIFQ